MKDTKKKLPLNKLNKANKNYDVRCYWGCNCPCNREVRTSSYMMGLSGGSR